MLNMMTCPVCGKICGASSGTICSSCQKLLDMVYDKARAYLRDHPKKRLHAPELAKAIGEDTRLVEILVLEGRFDTKDDNGPDETEAEKKARRLLEDLQKNLATPGKKTDADPGFTTYGADRYGREKK